MSATTTPARGRRVLAGLAAAAVFSGVVAAVPSLTPLGFPAAEAAGIEEASAPFVTSGATWRYLENDTFPSAGDADPLSWTRPGFTDAAWKSGAGTFGGKVSGGVQSPAYDAASTASVQLEMNAPSGDRVRTYFFRHTFELTAAQLDAIALARATVRVDDAAMVYVNGKETLRHEVGAGEEGLNYAPSGTTSLDSVPLEIPASDLKVGTNVIAVSVHNDRADSSDVWFSMSDLVPLTAEEARPRPTRIVLTPTDDPYTSQNITFQGAREADTLGRVEIRPAAGGDTKSVRAVLQPGSISNTFGHFSATVTGLKPGTEYTYRVSSQGSWSDWFVFETADRDEEEFQYVYYGDAQVGLDTTWPSVVRQAEERAPEAVGSVHAGDLIDTSSNDTQWENWFKGMAKSAASTNVMAAPGNHEYSGDKLMTAWKAHFEYPLNNPNDSTIGELVKLAQGDSPAAAQHRAYFDHWADFAQETVYFTDYQGVRFITVNATRDTTFLRPESVPSYSGEGAVTNVADLWTRYQAAWLDHVLETTESKWNVVTFHQPVYSTSSGRNEPVLRQHWVPVFQKHNIDLVQMGHDHTYARGFNNEDVTQTPGVTDGPVYMVSNSGAKHYNLESDARNVWTLNGATQVLKAQGLTTYQVVDVSEDALTVKSYVAETNPSYLKLFRNGEQVDAASVKVGDLWDEFTVHKSDDGRKLVTEAGMPAPEFEDLTPAPEVTTDLPARTPVTPGQRVTLRAEVSGAVSLQWQRKDVGGDWVDVPGATTSSLSLGRVHLDELGTGYRLVATAGSRTTTTTATVLVDGTRTPVLTTDLPRVVTVTSGTDATLRVRLDAETPAQLQWQRKQGVRWVDLVGRTGSVLALESVRNPAQYRVVATAGERTTTSRVVTVQVNRKASRVKVTKVVARKGRAVKVRLEATADGTATVKVVQGKKAMRRTVALKAGRTTTVTLAKLARKAKGRAAVTVRLDAAGLDHLDARATKTVRVKK